MSLHFVSGKPGGGKSYYALKLIVEELRFGARVVVTNLAVLWGELNAYIQEVHPELTVNLHKRVLLLEDNQIREFFMYRGGAVTVERTGDARLPLRFTFPDGHMEQAATGVFYVLDEVHLAFNARNWQQCGPEVTFYLSQHRKLGDDIIAVTQHVDKVDKQFRLDAQDVSYIANLGKQSWGKFRLPGGRFVRHTYLDIKTGPQAKPMETAWFKLDPKLAACYDTAKGVGIHGRGADKTERRKGLSLWWLLVPFCALLYVLISAPGWIRGGMAAFIKGADGAAKQVTASFAPPAIPTGGADTSRPFVQIAPKVEEKPIVTQLAAGLWAVEANARISGLFQGRALLNDGRTVPVEAATEDWILSGGYVYRWQKVTNAPLANPWPASTNAVIVEGPDYGRTLTGQRLDGWRKGSQ